VSSGGNTQKLRVRRKGNARIVRVPVWVRPGGTAVIVAVCSLSSEEPPEWIGTVADNSWFVSFSVAETDPASGVENFEIPDRRKLVAYLPRQVRPLVMPAVVKGLRVLVQEVEPSFLWGVTFEQHPPSKFLARYLMLIDALEDEGYRIELDGTDPKGRRFWTMKRNL
jgi:hypothetical protein